MQCVAGSQFCKLSTSYKEGFLCWRQRRHFCCVKKCWRQAKRCDWAFLDREGTEAGQPVLVHAGRSEIVRCSFCCMGCSRGVSVVIEAWPRSIETLRANRTRVKTRKTDIFFHRHLDTASVVCRGTFNAVIILGRKDFFETTRCKFEDCSDGINEKNEENNSERKSIIGTTIQ